MERADRRKHSRVETNNLISYESMGKEGNIISSSMGKALNVSQSGILLETPYLIEAENVTLVTVDLKNNLIKMTGKLVYCRETESGMFHAGINFTGSEEKTAKFAVKLIKSYHHRKHNMIVQVTA
jgi:hypothetical protein